MRTTRWLFLLLLLVSTSAFAQTSAQAPDSLPFTLKLIAPNIWAAIDDAKGDAGANAGFIIGDNGVAVVDTFENPAAAKALLGEIRKVTKLPVKFVINTHYHLDHVAGNAVFVDAGAIVLGHRNIREWIHSENLKLFGKDIKPEHQEMVKGLVAPEVVYDSGVTLYLGSRLIEVKFYPGHTGGDSVVFVPNARVAFCGDLFWRKTLPNLVDASTASWTDTLANFKSFALFTFVPGHGDVGNAADVDAFQGYLNDLRVMVKKHVDQGKIGDTLVSAVMPELKEKFGKWDFFDDFAKSNILDMAAELQGKKRVPRVGAK